MQDRYSNQYIFYAITLIFLVAVFNVVDRYILSILAPAIKAELELSDTQMGLLLGPSFSVIHFLFVLPAAWLADRFARRTMIAIGLAFWSTMTALGAGAGSFLQLFLTRMGVGIGEAAGSPPSAGLLSDTVPIHMRTRALSAITVGAIVGIAVGMVLGGYLGANYGWRIALLAVGLPGILLALLVRYTLREPVKKQNEEIGPLEAAKHLFSFASFRWAVLGACLTNIPIAAKSLWEPSFLDRIYGLSGLELGVTMVVINAVPTMFGVVVGATLTDRLAMSDKRWLALICGLAFAIGTPFHMAYLLWPADQMAMIFGSDIPLAFLISMVGSLFIGFFSAPMASLAQSLATDNMRSLAHAIWTMPFTLLGMGLGPLLVGGLSEMMLADYSADSLRYSLAVVSLLIPLGAFCFFVAGRTLSSDIDSV